MCALTWLRETSKAATKPGWQLGTKHGTQTAVSRTFQMTLKTPSGANGADGTATPMGVKVKKTTTEMYPLF